ncbi:MAG: RHS repeat-associated core domain-containing protein [Aquimonas sp.]|nr:RHS repeat-associated core domain-containing protein [Aquimonas sp.]
MLWADGGVEYGGAVVWRARNLAYHREQTVNHSGFGSLGLSFPGQYLDAESGMADNWHRVYDPSSGRYTQSDPIGLAGGVNTFAYVGGNPVNSVDPFGLKGHGNWNDVGTLSALGRETNPCVARAFVDSALNLTPFVGTYRALSGGEASSLDGLSSTASTSSLVLGVGEYFADPSQRDRLNYLKRMDVNRREQRAIINRLGSAREMRSLARVVSRSLGLFGLAVEGVNLSNRLQECGCEK